MPHHRPEYPAGLVERAARIRLACFDVDGTLTDGRLWFDEDGRESKAFNVLDGQGLVQLRKAGVTVAFITGDDLPDLTVLRIAGFAVAPASVHHWIRDQVHWVTPSRGGEGAARELCDLILHAQGRVAALLEDREG